MSITVYSRPLSTGDTVDIFQQKILENQQFGSNVEFVPTTTQALRQLANNPGGIYYDSTAAIVSQCTIKLLPLGLKRDDLVTPYQKPLVTAADCPQTTQQIKLRGTAYCPISFNSLSVCGFFRK